MSTPPGNIPFGPGYDEQSATNYATELASMSDALLARADYIVSTYSLYTANDIAAFWAAMQIPPMETPTAEMLEKANEFKAWTSTVKTMMDTAYAGDVGYQILRWRNAAPPPGFR